jgi:hypothetical protein
LLVQLLPEYSMLKPPCTSLSKRRTACNRREEEKKGKEGVGGEVRGDQRGEVQRNAYTRIGGNEMHQEGQISRTNSRYRRTCRGHQGPHGSHSHLSKRCCGHDQLHLLLRIAVLAMISGYLICVSLHYAS